ncbi:MAG: DUF4351 domain-containing protein [Gammaproteobacteria bacterium]
MAEIDYPPVQQALKRIRRLSADELAQHQAMMRERAVHTEITELRGAREDGLAEGRQLGRAEGREEGREEGLLEGKRSTLIRLLEQRFGPLADSQNDRIRTAAPAELDNWYQRIFDARSIEDLLG